MSKMQDKLQAMVIEGKLTAEEASELLEAQSERRDSVRVQTTTKNPGNITVAAVPGLSRYGLTSNVVGWVGVLEALGVDVQDTILPELVGRYITVVREQQETFISEGSTTKARENRRKNAEHAFAALGLTLDDES
ncbi:MAG: hypothetical protein ACXABD_21655 [Candidatus Thorarchaeota archaeon]|jgi:hypothetical protein